MMADENGSEAGFTLVETIAVLAIAALVFSIGAVALSSLKSRMSPMRTAEEIAQLMNAVHMTARNGSERSSAVIDLENKRVISPEGGRAIDIPSEFDVSVTLGRETVTDAKRLEVHFLTDGTSSGAEILISDRQKRKARVDINWLTGLARASDASR